MSGLMSPDETYYAEQEDGNLEEVPPGATANGVRDDVDIKISEGEIVIPEDVARWHGLKWFMDAREEAKAGLARMAQEGLIKRPEGTIASSEMPAAPGLMSPEYDMGMAEGGVADGGDKDSTSGDPGNVSTENDGSKDSGGGFDSVAVDSMMDLSAPAPAITDEREVSAPPGFGPAPTTGMFGMSEQQAGRVGAGLAAAAFGPGAAPMGMALGRGLETPEDVMSSFAALSPATALGFGITQGLHALGVPQTGLAAEDVNNAEGNDYYNGMTALDALSAPQVTPLGGNPLVEYATNPTPFLPPRSFI